MSCIGQNELKIDIYLRQNNFRTEKQFDFSVGEYFFKFAGFHLNTQYCIKRQSSPSETHLISFLSVNLLRAA